MLDHVVRSIVDNPDAVRVEGITDGDKIVLEVRVGEGDLGRVIVEHDHFCALREQFEPHTVGVVQRGHGPLPWVAERFVHHLMEQVHACRHSPDPVLQRVFRSIDVLA